MADALFIVVVVAFFTAATLVIAACDRIAGTSDPGVRDPGARDAD